MEENLETTQPVGAGQGGDVDVHTESLNAEASADAERPAGEGGQKQEDAFHKKDTQSRAENTAFKRMRQRIEALERENAAWREQQTGAADAPTPQRDAADPASAPDDAQLRQTLTDCQRQLLQYRQKQELDELRAHDPSLSVESIQALGEAYLRLRCAGIGNLAAYEAVRRTQEPRRTAPPDTGAVGRDTEQEPTYYTPEAVDRLTPRELDNPKIMERVMQSMTRWKK